MFSRPLTGKKRYGLRRLNLRPTEVTAFCGPATGFFSGGDEARRGGSNRGLGPPPSFARVVGLGPTTGEESEQSQHNDDDDDEQDDGEDAPPFQW